MECPLCAASNDPSAEICHICGSELKSQIINNAIPAMHDIEDVVVEETVALTNAHSTNRHKDRFLTISGALLLLIITAMAVIPFFRMPQDVMNSRKDFISVKKEYYADPEAWDQQKEQILAAMIEHRNMAPLYRETLSFKNLSLEVLMSFLMNDLDFDAERFDSTAIFPRQGQSGTTIILSKPEAKIWPLNNVILSLEMTLNNDDNDKLVLSFEKLRRGRSNLPVDKAWYYFTPELQSLRYFEMFAGGISEIMFSKPSSSPAITHAEPLTASWDYMHQTIH